MAVIIQIYWGSVVCGAFLVLNVLANGSMFSFSELFVPISNETHVSSSLLGEMYFHISICLALYILIQQQETTKCWNQAEC